MHTIGKRTGRMFLPSPLMLELKLPSGRFKIDNRKNVFIHQIVEVTATMHIDGH